MKPTLRAITEHRHRRPSSARELSPSRLRTARKAAVTPARIHSQDETDASNSLAGTPDLALLRVQGAGGPVDCASYNCECGFVFAASVSTTVCCPHCGTPQAW
jgi:hypothetical protein